MRTKIIAGNWKMNTSLADAHILATGVRDGVEHIERIETILCPPSIWLASVAHDIVQKGQYPHLHLGAQNMYYEDAGAFTGEISPVMVKEVAEYVILGHSERTHVFGESIELINNKVHASLAHGITPILCVGEDDQTETSKQIVLDTLRKLLDGVSEEDIKKVVVAYEPVWAIGTGKAATPEYAQEVIGYLREILSSDTRILYGGSANDENAKSYLSQPDIDGLLIGGASLKLKVFLTMCQIADDIGQDLGHQSLHS